MRNPTDSEILPRSACGTLDRVPRERLQDVPVCSDCGAHRLPGRPLTAEQIVGSSSRVTFRGVGFRVPMPIVDRLIAEPPRLHTDADGEPVDYGVAQELLHYLESTVRPGMRTLETGAGHSTLVFAAQGAEHACVMPDQGLVDRICGYAKDAGVDTARVTFHVAPSEKVLPTLDLHGIECALIDGRHAFPSACIDWYYIAERMAVGGIVVVDDIQLWSCRVLRDFLLEEPEWEVAVDMVPRWTAFRKLAEGSHQRTWHQQPYVVRMSRGLGRWRRVHKWLRRLRGG